MTTQKPTIQAQTLSRPSNAFYLPKYLTLLVHGPADAGKTYFASGVSDTHKIDDIEVVKGVLFGDVDGGMVTLTSNGILVERWPQDASKRLTTWKEVKEMFDYVVKHKGQYNTIVIDTLTRFQEEVKEALMKESGKDALQQQDWGRLLTHMTRVAKQSPDWGCHVVVTAHSRLQEDTNDKTQKWMPNFQGQFGDLAASFFDVVAYYKTVYPPSGQMVRRMYFHPQAGFQARTRFGLLPPYIDNPSLIGLLKKYEELRQKRIKQLLEFDPTAKIIEVQADQQTA